MNNFADLETINKIKIENEDYILVLLKKEDISDTKYLLSVDKSMPYKKDICDIVYAKAYNINDFSKTCYINLYKDGVLKRVEKLSEKEQTSYIMRFKILGIPFRFDFQIKKNQVYQFEELFHPYFLSDVFQRKDLERIVNAFGFQIVDGKIELYSICRDIILQVKELDTRNEKERNLLTYITKYGILRAKPVDIKEADCKEVINYSLAQAREVFIKEVKRNIEIILSGREKTQFYFLYMLLTGYSFREDIKEVLQGLAIEWVYADRIHYRYAMEDITESQLNLFCNDFNNIIKEVKEKYTYRKASTLVKALYKKELRKREFYLPHMKVANQSFLFNTEYYVATNRQTFYSKEELFAWFDTGNFKLYQEDKDFIVSVLFQDIQHKIQVLGKIKHYSLREKVFSYD